MLKFWSREIGRITLPQRSHYSQSTAIYATSIFRTSFEWSAYRLVPSSIQDSNLNLSSNCTVFSNFPDLRGTNVSFRCQDGNPIEFTSSNATMVDASIAGGSTLSLSSGSKVNWVSSTNLSSPLSDDPDDKLMISWFIDVEVTNQNGFGIPFATVDLSFDRLKKIQLVSSLFRDLQTRAIHRKGLDTF